MHGPEDGEPMTRQELLSIIKIGLCVLAAILIFYQCQSKKNIEKQITWCQEQIETPMPTKVEVVLQSGFQYIIEEQDSSRFYRIVDRNSGMTLYSQHRCDPTDNLTVRVCQGCSMAILERSAKMKIDEKRKEESH